MLQKQELKLSAHCFAATNKPPRKPFSYLTVLCRSCCRFADKLASSCQPTGSLMHGSDESNPHSTVQGICHQSNNNTVHLPLVSINRGQSVVGAAVCQTPKSQCWLLNQQLWSNRVKMMTRKILLLFENQWLWTVTMLTQILDQKGRVLSYSLWLIKDISFLISNFNQLKPSTYK